MIPPPPLTHGEKALATFAGTPLTPDHGTLEAELALVAFTAFVALVALVALAALVALVALTAERAMSAVFAVSVLCAELSDSRLAVQLRERSSGERLSRVQCREILRSRVRHRDLQPQRLRRIDQARIHGHGEGTIGSWGHARRDCGRPDRAATGGGVEEPETQIDRSIRAMKSCPDR